MKREYVRPTATVDNFATDAFCTNSACGATGKVYNFECNAGNTDSHYAIKDASGEYATISGYKMTGYAGAYSGTRYFHPCSAGVHNAPSDSIFLTGYHIDDVATSEDENIAVVVWTNNNTEVHCTTQLDMNSWTTVKS